MGKLSPLLRESLEKRAAAYQDQLFQPGAENLLAYLTEGRGLTLETIQRFRLGAVVSPVESDDPAHGMIAIPYITPAGVVALRFRRPPHTEDGPKYWQPAGTNITMFNTEAVRQGDSYIIVTEGEIDCMTLAQCGLPTVGLPGASSWRPHYRAIFSGFDRVIICGDNDDQGAGKEFAAKVAEHVPGPAIYLMPPGHDVNSLFIERGADALLAHLKLK